MPPNVLMVGLVRPRPVAAPPLRLLQPAVPSPLALVLLLLPEIGLPTASQVPNVVVVAVPSRPANRLPDPCV